LIPKIIWQTYKDPRGTLQPYMHEAINTWIMKNPGYEYRYMDDAQSAQFIKEEYGDEVHDLFVNLPVGVMRGDMWRYLVIYKYGGVYADLDTLCLQPIVSWMKNDKSFIVCPEHQDHFCQWTFAAEAGHPILKAVVDLMISRLKNADYTMPHFVHYLTGPAMWTSAICDYLGIYNNDPYGRASHKEGGEGLTVDMESFNETDIAKENGFYCYAGDKWRIFHWDAVRHIYGSQNWNHGYVKWIEDDKVKGSRDES